MKKTLQIFCFFCKKYTEILIKVDVLCIVNSWRSVGGWNDQLMHTFRVGIQREKWFSGCLESSATGLASKILFKKGTQG
jgi:hypothetical protein